MYAHLEKWKCYCCCYCRHRMHFVSSMFIHFGLVCFCFCFVVRLLLMFALFTIHWYILSYFILLCFVFFPRELCRYYVCVCAYMSLSIAILLLLDCCCWWWWWYAVLLKWKKKKMSIIRHDYANCSLFIINFANDSPISIEIFMITILLKAPSIASTRFFLLFSIEWMAFRLWERECVLLPLCTCLHACIRAYVRVCKCLCVWSLTIHWLKSHLHRLMLMNKNKTKNKKNSIDPLTSDKPNSTQHNIRFFSLL